MNDDYVPPTQYLVMEVLAARWRTGEKVWTFPNFCKPALRALCERNWLRYKSGIVQDTQLVWLSDDGIKAWGLDQPYRKVLK